MRTSSIAHRQDLGADVGKHDRRLSSPPNWALLFRHNRMLSLVAEDTKIGKTYLVATILEVDPIQRRIVLAVTNIPEGQERPETPSKVIPVESDDYMSDPIPVPIPATFDEIDG